MVPLVTVNTRNILFICGGAFPDLEDIIRKRLSKQTGIGFSAVIKDSSDRSADILRQVKTEDLRKFGMIPEFIGRLPVLVTLNSLDEEALVKILTEPKNALVRQYAKLLSFDDVELEFTPDALQAIAQQALGRKSGARGLRAIIEGVMLDTMFELPSLEGVKKCGITKEAVLNGERPRLIYGKAEQPGVDKPVERLQLASPGRQTPAQFDQTVRDISNFLEYAGEPAALKRQSLGVWVVLFLALLTFLAYLLKKEYWKDVH
jgi:ATP-dependent protease Clp ATPase subunit